MSYSRNPRSILIRSAYVLFVLIYLLACADGTDGDKNPITPVVDVLPKDTYFSLAVTENSHNHVGARLLFLDFQDSTANTSVIQNNIVISPKVSSGDIVLDGDASEWTTSQLSTVNGLPQNNYPLSEFYDGVATNIAVGSAWDGTYIYFLVQWRDAANDTSTKFRKWVYGDQGSGETGWNPKVHKPVVTGAPNETVVNSSHTLAGAEDEDRVLMMFPIVDSEYNFVAVDANDSSRRGLGCAAYCHPNLIDDDATQAYTGDGVAEMHTNVSGDKADIWHWKSSRTHPQGYADDKYLEEDTGPTGNDGNGRQADGGTSAYASNILVNNNPTYSHLGGISNSNDVLVLAANSTQNLYDSNITSVVNGDEIPFIINQQPSGSRADVEAEASFSNNTWTVELRRRLTTSDTNSDHQFMVGTDASPPNYTALSSPGNAVRGQTLFTSVDSSCSAPRNCQACSDCHQEFGQGDALGATWDLPRNQRASSSLILKTLRNFNDIPNHLMEDLFDTLKLRSASPDVIEKNVEDIGAYLQQQHTNP